MSDYPKTGTLNTPQIDLSAHYTAADLERAGIAGALAMREAMTDHLYIQRTVSCSCGVEVAGPHGWVDHIRNVPLPEPMGAELEKLLAEANLNGFRTGEKVAQDDYEVKLAEARAEALQHWCFHFVPQRGWCCSCGFLLLANGTHSDAEHAQSEHVTQWAAEARQGQEEPEGD